MPVGGFTVRAFLEDDLRMLRAVGGMLGAAIDNARAGRPRQPAPGPDAALLAEIDRAIVEDRDLSSRSWR